MDAVQEVFPNCCIHFEDWTGVDAVHLLATLPRPRAACYNDDVQGTAGITLAGMINACKIKGTQLKDESYLFLGAGSAGIGLSNLLCSALVEQGLTLEQAQSRIHMFDNKGLLEPSRTDLVDFQKPYAHPHSPMPLKEFASAIKEFKPTTHHRREHHGRRLHAAGRGSDVAKSTSVLSLLALSNPTEHAECTAEQAYRWSNGKAIYAAGVPFPPMVVNSRTFLPGQANNFYIFPAVGMADLRRRGPSG